jgi:hypothetical protein
MVIVVRQRPRPSTQEELAVEDHSAVLKQGHVALVGYVSEGGAPTAGAAAEDGAAEILSARMFLCSFFTI